MKLVVSIVTLAAVLTACTATEQQQQQQQQQPPQLQQVPASAAAASPQSPTISSKPQQLQPQAASGERQGRSISSSGNTGNSLLSSNTNNGNLNIIEHSSGKSRLEQEKRQVQEFLTTKNIIKSIVKLLFGNQDEVSATSRNVLSVVNKVLDLLKNTFGQKSRSGTARTIRDSAEEAASAGVSMLQGYVKSVLAPDSQCAKRYLCQASREAIRDGRDLGYVIATVGSYASSYMLDSTKSNGFNTFYDASLKGRSAKEDCTKIYPDCAE